MRRTLIYMVLLCFAVSLKAQPLHDELRKNIRCSASNYMVYPGPTQSQLTPAPDGKKPFYISHYGRHGSRYLSHERTYETPYQILAKADSAGKLTDLGRDVMHRLDVIRRDAYKRWGDLTPLGAQQHRQIMRRMVERFPEVFADSADVDARSTMTLRCILSMEHAMMQLSMMKPLLRIHHNATQRDAYYMRFQDKHLPAMTLDSTAQATFDAFSARYEKNDRLLSSLFNDADYWRQVDGAQFNYTLFKVACIVQNTPVSQKLTLYDLFTDDEIYNNWKKENAWWYTALANTPLNQGKKPFLQRNLLRKLIACADSCIQLERPGLQLRYGHDTVILPLVCLLDVNGYGWSTDDLEDLDRHGWANYKIFPMAANLQLVFYRRDAQDRDVLVKVLLNENEASLPLPADQAPYYRWTDFRSYYLKKLDDYEIALPHSRREN